MTPRQRELLDELRRRQIREAAALTPAQRLGHLLGLLDSLDALPHPRSRGLDESPELLLAQLARWRRLRAES